MLTKIRVIRAIRVHNKIFVSFESFVFKNLVQASKFIIVKSTLRQAATIQHSTFKSQHCAPRLRVQIIFVKFGLFVFKNPWAPRREQYPCDRCDPCAKIFVQFVLFVFNKSCVKDPCDPCDPCAYKKQSKIRVQKLFVSFGLLPPFGQWAYGESRVQKSRVQKNVSAPPRTRVRSVRSVCK